MSQIELSAQDVDAAMANLKKSLETDEIALTANNQSVEKSIVSKRAMGGAVKEEDAHESGAGRLYKDGKDPGAHPADGGYKDNFATAYPMDQDKAEGSALSGAIKDSAIMKKEEKYKRGMTKAVKSSKSSKSSASSSSMSKSIDSAGSQVVVKDGAVPKASGTSAPKKSSKAPVPTADTMEKNMSGASYSSMSKAISSKSSKSSTSSKKSVAKAVDQSSVDSNGMSSGSATPKESAAAGSTSGATRLGKSVKAGKYVGRAVENLSSAKKHLSKAFEDGMGDELITTGERLIEAKRNVLKALKAGEPIADGLVERMDKTARYFGKSLDAYEAEKMDAHTKYTEKTISSLEKSLNTQTEFQKSLSKSVETKTVNGIKFLKKGHSYTAILDESQYKAAKNALNKVGLYKSLSIDESAQKTVEVSPLLKSLVGELTKSHDSLRDALLDRNDRDEDFKNALVKSLDGVNSILKNVLKDVEKLKGEPNMRKSIVTALDSPLEGKKQQVSIEKSQVSDILLKGFAEGKIQQQDVLSWDVVKDTTENIPQEYIQLCRKLTN